MSESYCVLGSLYRYASGICPAIVGTLCCLFVSVTNDFINLLVPKRLYFRFWAWCYRTLSL